MGIHTVFQLIFAARAVVSTGATISATTAGRIPWKMLLISWLFFMSSGVKKIAIARIIIKDGRIVPSADTMLPLSPRRLSPITTDILTANEVDIKFLVVFLVGITEVGYKALENVTFHLGCIS